MAQERHDSEKLADLMRAGQDGDKRAYAQLLAEIAPIVRRFVRRQRSFLDREDVEDIVQNVLISVHSVRQTYDPERPFLPWLIAISRNRMIDSGRRYVRRSAHEVRVEAPPVTFSDPDPNFEQHVWRSGRTETHDRLVAGRAAGGARAAQIEGHVAQGVVAALKFRCTVR